MRSGTRTARRSRAGRGYALITVLIVLLILLATGAYTLRSADHDLRASAKIRRGELLSHAAEAGAALRMSEIALVSEPIAILDDASSAAYASWTPWPAAGEFTSADFDQSQALVYRTAPIRLTWTGKAPPPGVPSGTNTYIFEITSFAASRDDGSTMGEGAVSVAIKTWDVMPGSYAP